MPNHPTCCLLPAYATTPRGLIHYAQAGRGAPPLLLLHATPGSHRAFAQLAPLLAPAFRVIAPDTPGYGNSQALAGDCSIEALAASMIDLLDTLGLARAHVLGLHTGNKIAAAMASGWPDRVDRVVLAGQTHSLIVDKAQRDSAIHHLVDHYFPRFGPSVDGVHRVRSWLMAQADVQSLWWPPQLLAGADVSAEDVEIAEAMVIDHLLGWRSIVPTYQAIFRFDLAAAMRRIAAPTLVLELRPDDEAHLAAQAPAICAIVPGARGAALQGCDAGVFRRQPERVADAVLPFLAG
jgi:pimeloyl-ACP methyl ester carboxylesterase